jgi:nitroimidazol reductase NimA-like FMN-containing flavoprotein (pyridoxamine 5'-phosphate oxidase superfamily)
MTTYPPTDQNRVRRIPKRGHYDAETIYGIVDAALICHVSFVQEGQPFIIPTLHARDGDSILLHGASTSRLLQHAGAGHPLCIAVTMVDALVLARSVFDHSVNYRSVVIFGRGRLVEDESAKYAALERFTDKLLPGRWADARLPTATEMKATAVVRVEIENASAKIRTGPPGDEEADLALPVWAGLLPIHTSYGTLEPAPDLLAGIPVPGYLQAMVQTGEG